MSVLLRNDGRPAVGAPIIFCVVEDALATAMVAHRVASFREAQHIKPLLDNNPDCNLRTRPVRTYLPMNPNALTFSANPTEAEALTKAMKRLERAYRIAPLRRRDAAQLQTKTALNTRNATCARPLQIKACP